MDQSTDTPTPKTPQSAPDAKKVNRLARWAFAIAILSWVFFVSSAAVDETTAMVLSPVGFLLAFVALVMGLVALRRRPRQLAIGACVFGGVLVVVLIMLLVGFHLLRSL